MGTGDGGQPRGKGDVGGGGAGGGVTGPGRVRMRAEEERGAAAVVCGLDGRCASCGVRAVMGHACGGLAGSLCCGGAGCTC